MTLEDHQQDSFVSKDKTCYFKDSTHMENLSNALVSFLSLSKQVKRPELFNQDKTNSTDLNDVKVNTEPISRIKKDRNNAQFKSLNEFIKETAPRNWTVAVMQESLKSWIEGLKSDYGISLDFALEVIFDSEKNITFLKIGESLIRLYSKNEWENLLDTYRKDIDWKEIEKNEIIETKGLSNVKYLEATILNSINKNNHSCLYEILWLAYKTSDDFIMFKSDTKKRHHIFIKEGDFLSSIEI
ncbi:MAG: hypothetical protein ACFFAS_06115 [Promethearchaeota archaeon]